MKKLFLGKAILLSVLIVFMVVPLAKGDQIALYQSSYSYGLGGEFTARIINSTTGPDLNLNLAYYTGTTSNIGSHDPSFQTFCLEYREYFNTNTPYNITISDRAMYGGVGSSGDPISVGTAWLYQQFTTGALGNYNYGSNRSTSAGYLQEIIWYLEGERSNYSLSNPFDDMLITQFGSISNAIADNEGKFSVAVLNIYDSNGGFHQDQLVLAPVPEPSTILLIGSGLIGFGIFGRKRFRRKK